MSFNPPITPTAAPAAPLDSYLMYVRTSLCSCGHLSSWSELFEVRFHHATRQLRPVGLSAQLHNLPIGVTRLPLAHTPICLDCVTAFSQHTRDLSTHEAQVEWAHTLARKYAPRTAPIGAVAVKPNRPAHIIAQISDL